MIGTTRSCLIETDELREKVLSHLRLKKSMTVDQICVALAVPRMGKGRGRMGPPRWLTDALKAMESEGEIQFSNLYQAYRLPQHRPRTPASRNSEVFVYVDPKVATWSPRQWEERQAQKQAAIEERNAVERAEAKERRKEARQMLQAQPKAAKPAPQPQPSMPRRRNRSEKARLEIEAKIRCLVRSERQVGEGRLEAVLGKRALEIAQQMPDIKRHEFMGRGFLSIKQGAAAMEVAQVCR